MTADQPAPRPASAPPPRPSFEDLLVGALDSLDRMGPAGLADYLAQHPVEAERLCRHVLDLHDIGFVGGDTGTRASPPVPPPAGEADDDPAASAR